MALGGYDNKVARINLSTGDVTYENIPEDWTRLYIGGRGLGVRYCLEADPQADPLGPDNLLCFMTGPLTGTRARMSGRMAVVTKSPLTDTITDSHQGGWSAARMRWAGFDGLIFEGQSDKPVYVYVEDGKVELRDASDLWGKGVHEVVEIMEDRHAAKDLSVIAIGQAGEQQVKFAAWINEDDRASGRGGTGAVGGSKNLKAVVIHAKNTLETPADKEAWSVAHKAAHEALAADGAFTEPKKGGLPTLGTNILTNITNSIGSYPTRNAQETSFEDAELISGEYVKENILESNPTCHACPVACKKAVKVVYQGTHLHMESVEYESAWSLGGYSGNKDIASIAWMINQCNDLGLDTIEMGAVLATYMEICERGLNGDDENLAWGDHEHMVKLVEKTALREGVGDVLAEGVARVGDHYDSPELAMHVRGQSIPAYDPRGQKGMGVAYATSNRGACHLRGYVTASELGVVEPNTDPLAYEGKGELLKVFQDLFAFTDSLDVCKFSTFSETAGHFADQYASLVGVEGFSADDVLMVGERIYNLERYYNQLAGEQPGSDTLPRRFLEEPSKSPGSEGHICELEPMLVEYYAARGWESGGVVPEAKLKALQII